MALTEYSCRMDRYVTDTEATEHFADILRDVAEGQSVTVTADGRPLARIAPVDVPRPASLAEVEAIMARWAQLPPVVAGHWRREDLYD